MLISIVILITGLVLVGVTRKRHRARGFIRWTGLTLTVGLLLLWVSSMRYTFGYVGSSAVVYFESGGFSVFATQGQMPATGWMGIGRSRWPTVWLFSVPAVVPLTAGWLPVVAVAIPTALTSPRRRPAPGRCHECGYDLTGNESGVCPECGTEITKP